MNTNDRNTVGEFARSVRAQLSDLPALDVEELTEGLEADLAERLAEGGEELGDPVAYAAELRASAGLAPKAPLPAAVPLRRSLAIKAREVLAAPAGPPVHGLAARFPDRPAPRVVGAARLDRLRPARCHGHARTGRFFPRNFFEFVAWVGLIGVSVQWGRGRWLGSGTAGKTMKIAISVVAAVLMVPLLADLRLSISVNRAALRPAVQLRQPRSPAPEGVVNDGDNVSNVFAYDCSGQAAAQRAALRPGRQKSCPSARSARSTPPTTTRTWRRRIYGVPNQVLHRRARAGTSSRWTSTGRIPYVEDGTDPGRVPGAPAVRRRPAAAERVPAGHAAAAGGPAAHHDADGADPRSRGREGHRCQGRRKRHANPKPESRARRNRGSPRRRRNRPSRPCTVGRAAPTATAQRRLVRTRRVGSGLRVSRAAGAWPGTGPRPAGHRPRGSRPSAAPPGSRAARSPIQSAGWRRLPRWSW